MLMMLTPRLRWYRPPELLWGSRYYSPAVDMWSIGTILVELVLRVPFLAGDSDIDQLKKTFHAMGSPTETDWPVRSCRLVLAPAPRSLPRTTVTPAHPSLLRATQSCQTTTRSPGTPRTPGGVWSPRWARTARTSPENCCVTTQNFARRQDRCVVLHDKKKSPRGTDAINKTSQHRPSTTASLPLRHAPHRPSSCPSLWQSCARAPSHLRTHGHRWSRAPSARQSLPTEQQ